MLKLAACHQSIPSNLVNKTATCLIQRDFYVQRRYFRRDMLGKQLESRGAGKPNTNTVGKDKKKTDVKTVVRQEARPTNKAKSNVTSEYVKRFSDQLNTRKARNSSNTAKVRATSDRPEQPAVAPPDPQPASVSQPKHFIDLLLRTFGAKSDTTAKANTKMAALNERMRQDKVLEQRVGKAFGKEQINQKESSRLNKNVAKPTESKGFVSSLYKKMSHAMEKNVANIKDDEPDPKMLETRFMRKGVEDEPGTKSESHRNVALSSKVTESKGHVSKLYKKMREAQEQNEELSKVDNVDDRVATVTKRVVESIRSPSRDSVDLLIAAIRRSDAQRSTPKIFLSQKIVTEGLFADESDEYSAMRRELSKRSRHAFDEQIRLTKEGKLWRYPINNEDGNLLYDENASFKDHVLLHRHLTGFPDHPAITQFMRLVAVALSDNFYLSVEEKKQEIDWYREYFNNIMLQLETAEKELIV